jgi:hypothetical protein
MGLDQSSLLLAPLTDHRNQLCRLSKMPSDERASSASTAISLFHFANHRSMRIGNGTRCHKNVILMVVNGGKIRTKGE